MASNYEFSHWDEDGLPINTNGTLMLCAVCGCPLNEDMQCDTNHEIMYND